MFDAKPNAVTQSYSVSNAENKYFSDFWKKFEENLKEILKKILNCFELKASAQLVIPNKNFEIALENCSKSSMPQSQKKVFFLISIS